MASLKSHRGQESRHLRSDYRDRQPLVGSSMRLVHLFSVLKLGSRPHIGTNARITPIWRLPRVSLLVEVLAGELVLNTEGEVPNTPEKRLRRRLDRNAGWTMERTITHGRRRDRTRKNLKRTDRKNRMARPQTAVRETMTSRRSSYLRSPAHKSTRAAYAGRTCIGPAIARNKRRTLLEA